MNYHEVESSNIKALAHKDDQLGVKFTNGSEYIYDNVPNALFHEIVMAASVGRTFNELIKAQPSDYPYRRVA